MKFIEVCGRSFELGNTHATFAHFIISKKEMASIIKRLQSGRMKRLRIPCNAGYTLNYRVNNRRGKISIGCSSLPKATIQRLLKWANSPIKF